MDFNSRDTIGNQQSSILNFTRSDFQESDLEGQSQSSSHYTSKQRFIWLLHGWMMWVCWGLMGFMMVWSNRYLKHHWRLNMIIHSLCGTGLFLLNLIFGLGAIVYLDWKIKCSLHGILGSILSILLPFSAIEGIIARILFKRLRWKTHVLLIIQDFHKVSQIIPTFIKGSTIIVGYSLIK